MSLFLAAAYALLVVVAIPAVEWSRVRRGMPLRSVRVSLARMVLLSTGLLLVLRVNDVPLEAVGLSIGAPASFLFATTLCTGVVIGLDIASFAVARAAFERGSLAASAAVVQQIPSGHDIPWFALLCVISAFWEELFFRGVALGLFERSTWPVVLGASAIIFALHHLGRGRVGAIYSFCYALLFSALYLVTGNLISVMIAHAAGNLFTSTYTARRLRAMQRMLELF